MAETTKSECTLALDELDEAVAKVRIARVNARATGGEEKLEAAIASVHPIRDRAYALTVAEGTTEERVRLSMLLSDPRLLRKA